MIGNMVTHHLRPTLASFDGTDDFIDVPDHDDLSFGDTLTDEPFSLSAWVVFANPSVNQAIMEKYNENVDSEYLLRQTRAFYNLIFTMK